MVPRIPNLKVISWESYFPQSSSDPLALNTGNFWEPQKYIDFFEQIMKNGDVVRFVANRYMEDGEPLFDTNIQCLITSFETQEKGGMTGDIFYSIELSEYRDYTPATVQIQLPTPTQPAATVETEPARETPKTEIVVGSIVICNGKYYASSYQDEPHGTFSNFRGKVAKIITTDPNRPLPYLITTESGGGRGWVAKSQIQVVT